MAHTEMVNGELILRDDWSVEDVKAAAKEMKRRITKAQCINVLETLARRFDANNGINWDIIKCTIDLELPQKSYKKK
jgi:hypothetical protein